MLRGILIMMAFCLSLVALWHLADRASQRSQLMQEHYAMDGPPLLVDEEQNGFLEFSQPAVRPRWHDCEYRSVECAVRGCDGVYDDVYLRFQ